MTQRFVLAVLTLAILCTGCPPSGDEPSTNEVRSTCWPDADGDGYGDASASSFSCTGASDEVENDDDCDDSDPAVNPTGTEICNGVDDDCFAGLPTDEQDQDSDGLSICEGDCNDLNGSIGPNQPELCDGVDNDCDGAVPADETDGDGDGWLSCADCEDTVATVYPGAVEQCDGLDGNCDGFLPADEADSDGDGLSECMGDCDDLDATIPLAGFEWCDGVDSDCNGVIPVSEVDADGDGVMICDGDCADGNPAQAPGLPEICDGLDNDCDGQLLPTETTDADGDGAIACLDCDDAEPLAAPGLPEICDGVDSDCDGVLPLDEADLDGDGALVCLGLDCDDADPAVYVGAPLACDGQDTNCDGVPDADEVDDDGDGVTECAGDCDDTDPTTSPAEPEVCNGVDSDCDGVNPSADGDGDGLGFCEGDCDDQDPTVFLAAPELCDGLDNDCDGLVPPDETDGDGDGALLCIDCDDTDPLAGASVTETCDGIDTDCDGLTPGEQDLDGDGQLDCDLFGWVVDWMEHTLAPADALATGLTIPCPVSSSVVTYGSPLVTVSSLMWPWQPAPLPYQTTGPWQAERSFGGCSAPASSVFPARTYTGSFDVTNEYQDEVAYGIYSVDDDEIGIETPGWTADDGGEVFSFVGSLEVGALTEGGAPGAGTFTTVNDNTADYSIDATIDPVSWAPPGPSWDPGGAWDPMGPSWPGTLDPVTIENTRSLYWSRDYSLNCPTFDHTGSRQGAVDQDGGPSGSWQNEATVGRSNPDCFACPWCAISVTSGCELEPVSGDVSFDVRDSSGTVLQTQTVTYDGATQCDGCGTWSVDGVVVGERCGGFPGANAYTPRWSP